MEYEILEAIEQYYHDDNDSIAYALSYLYNTTNSHEMKYMIKQWCINNSFCPHCGVKLSIRKYIDKVPYGDTYTDYETFEEACDICDFTF